jgi:hypothetical protein
MKDINNIPKVKVADKPIEIMYFSTGESALMVQPNLVIVGEIHMFKLLSVTKV